MDKAVTVLLGGRGPMGGIYAVFWFITCLFFTQSLFHYICDQKALILALFVLAHIEAIMVPPSVLVPWDLDVTACAIGYYAVGYYAKDFLANPPKWAIVLCLIVGLSAFTAHYLGFDYFFSMKYLKYDNILFDSTVPIALTLLVMAISKWLPPQIGVLGKHSMTIMYLHVPILWLMEQHIPGFFIPVITTVAISFSISYICYVFRRKLIRSDSSRFSGSVN